jgi:hypothetical protein
VHDGDTIKLLIDLGFDARAEKWIRLAGVHAPELNQTGGPETRQYTRGWLASRCSPSRGLKWPLRVVTEITHTSEPTEVQSFARYIGMVYDIETGGCLNMTISVFLAEHPDWPGGK